MEEEVKNSKISIKISFSVIILIAACLIIFLSFRQLRLVAKEEFSADSLKRISNLHSLKCSFKNVAVMEKETPILGMEKYFIEYKATVDIGIDMSELDINEEEKKIVIPKAKVMYKTYDANSIEEYRSTRIFTSSISNNEVKNLLAKSLDDLVKEIEQNDTMMHNAQNIAANQIDNLIKNLYSVSGKIPEYKYEYQ